MNEIQYNQSYSWKVFPDASFIVFLRIENLILIAILKRMFYDFLCEKKIIHQFITILQGAR